MNVEDTILAECAERRRALGLPDPGPRPFVPPLGCAIRDLSPTQLADLLFYLDAGYLELVPREPVAFEDQGTLIEVRRRTA